MDLVNVQAMHKAAAAVFPAAAAALKEMAPAVTADAIAAESDAADHAQVPDLALCTQGLSSVCPCSSGACP